MSAVCSHEFGKTVLAARLPRDGDRDRDRERMMFDRGRASGGVSSLTGDRPEVGQEWPKAGGPPGLRHCLRGQGAAIQARLGCSWLPTGLLALAGRPLSSQRADTGWPRLSEPSRPAGAKGMAADGATGPHLLFSCPRLVDTQPLRPSWALPSWAVGPKAPTHQTPSLARRGLVPGPLGGKINPGRHLLRGSQASGAGRVPEGPTRAGSEPRSE